MNLVTRAGNPTAKRAASSAPDTLGEMYCSLAISIPPHSQMIRKPTLMTFTIMKLNAGIDVPTAFERQDRRSILLSTIKFTQGSNRYQGICLCLLCQLYQDHAPLGGTVVLQEVGLACRTHPCKSIPVNTSLGILECEVAKLGGKKKTLNFLIHLFIGWRACKYLGTLRVLGSNWSLVCGSEYTQQE